MLVVLLMPSEYRNDSFPVSCLGSWRFDICKGLWHLLQVALILLAIAIRFCTSQCLPLFIYISTAFAVFFTLWCKRKNAWPRWYWNWAFQIYLFLLLILSFALDLCISRPSMIESNKSICRWHITKSFSPFHIYLCFCFVVTFFLFTHADMSMDKRQKESENKTRTTRRT